MKKYVVVSLPEVTDIFIVDDNQYDRYLRAQRESFSEFIQHFDRGARDSTVGIPRVFVPGLSVPVPLGRPSAASPSALSPPPLGPVKTGPLDTVMKQVRTSQTIDNIKIYDETYTDLSVIADVYPRQSRRIAQRITLMQDNNADERVWQLHAYSEGGFFAAHTDGQQSETHFGSLLLFPPASISPFTGGDLILTIRDEKVTISPSTFTAWTLVAFHIDVLHECTPVTSGRRFVFKSNLHLPEEGDLFRNTTKSTTAEEGSDRIPTGIAFDNETQFIEGKITKLEMELAKYRQQLQHFQGLNPTGIQTCQIPDHVQRLLDIVDENCLIVLPKCCKHAAIDPSSLEGSEAVLWREILKVAPYSSLTTITVKHNRGDGSDDAGEFRPEEDEIAEKYDCNVHVLGSIDGNYGFVEDVESEYNDQTYDHIDTIRLLAICVQFEPCMDIKTLLNLPSPVDSDADE